jgi:hypothetical protein
MPRYFFDTHDGGRERDHDGCELPDPHAARIEAIRYGAAVLHDQPELIWDGRDFRVEVRDDAGKLVVTVIMMAVDAPAH